MGFLDHLRRNIPGSPKNIAQHLLKYYLSDVTKYPNFNPKQIFKKMLQDRYKVFKPMSADDINKVVANTDTLVELTLSVIAYENPAAMSSHYQKETLNDIFKFFEENAPLEFKKFAMKAKITENEKNIKENYKAGKMPERYDLESKIATLIDNCTSEMFNDPNACIVMYKNYEFAWARVQENKPIPFQEDILAKVYLKEVEPFFNMLSDSKKRGLNQKDPEVYVLADMFAIACLNILLPKNVE